MTILDMVRMIVCTLISIPLSTSFRLFHSPFIRETLGLVLGLLMSYLVYRE